MRKFVLALLAASIPATAHAWGPDGHRMLGEIAARNLPADLPAFLHTDDAVWQLGELSREPDRSRNSGNPHDADLNPAHFADVGDDLTIGGIPLNALPPTREDYAAALRARGTDDYKMGYLPYAIAEGFQQLVKDFAYWRADAAGVKFAKSDKERDWLARDRTLRESLIIRDLGYWSHFVEDASQPMHASVHYDGWGDFPNPNGYPNQKGLHIQFEDAFVHDNVSEADIEAALPAPQPVTGDILAWTGAYLARTQAEVVPLYEMAKREPFNGHDPQEKAFAVERLAAGAAALRDLV
ncbi:MAG TPA: hypothetical protein VG867_03855, partial [Rhizomicrobium sp.]|nr:hypothetical protein [Rhizomicrobium sp.]